MGVDGRVAAGASQILPYTGVGRVLVAPEFGNDETHWPLIPMVPYGS